MSEIMDKYTMLTSWSLTQKARTIEYGSTIVVTGYDTTYDNVGSRISLSWLYERLAII